MFKMVRRTWALFLASTMVMAGHGLNVSHLGIRGPLEGFGPLTMGIVVSAYSIGFLLSALVTPSLITRVGYVRVYAAFVAGGSVSVLLYGELLHPSVWFAARVLSGLCMSGMFVVSESWLNASSHNEERGRLLSFYVVTQLVGLLLGQALLNLAPPEAYTLFVLSSVLISMSCVAMLLVAAPAPVLAQVQRVTLGELYKVSPLGFVGVAFMGMSFAVAYSLGAVFAVAAGFSISQISLFIAAIYAGGTLFQYPVGWLSDRFERRRVVMGLCLGALAVSVSAFFFARDPYALIALAAGLGATMVPMHALLLAHVNDFVDPQRTPSVSAGLITMQGIGSLCGPVIAGWAMGYAGHYAYFAVLGCIAFSMFTFTVYRSYVRTAVPGGEGTAFVPMPPKVTPTGAEMFGDLATQAEQEADGKKKADR